MITEKRILCKSCWMAARKSKVYPEYQAQPLGSSEETFFYDETGRYHVHSSTGKDVKYRCSNGHEWTDVDASGCWCGWKTQPKK